MTLDDIKQILMNAFEIEDISLMPEAIKSTVKNNNFSVYDKIIDKGINLDIDFLQIVFQYYEADRENKKQDYTPKTLAQFVGELTKDSDTIIDMCAGSGALTIQRWLKNKETKFELWEYDEKVIWYLMFNMAIRNIECCVKRADVLSDEVFEEYKISKGEKYGILHI